MGETRGGVREEKGSDLHHDGAVLVICVGVGLVGLLWRELGWGPASEMM